MNFSMNEVEIKRFHQWEETHLAEKHGGKAPYCGAIGGGLTFEFTPTSIGTAVWVRCFCGEKSNLTDFDSW